GTYRGHGHALAKGTEPEPLLAEMLGRATGVCGGRAGSMNVIDLAHGLVGCYGIVGGSIAAALGAGLSAQRQGRLSVGLFRHDGHSKSDPAPYRTKEELERWRERDPLTLCRDRLLAEGISEGEIAAVEQASSDAVEQAVESALAAPYPDPAGEHATEYGP